MKLLVQRLLPHIVAFFVFLLMCVFYFLPQTEGKQLRQSDITQYLGMSQEIKDFKKETGETTLWTNSMFGGMPTYQINTVKAGNKLSYLDSFFRLYFGSDQPIGRFFTAMIGFYILLVILGVNPWLSMAGAVAFGFSTNNFILFEAGHLTKFKTISFFPFMIAGMLLAFKEKYVWGGILFTVGMGLSIMSNHIQMNYILFLTLLIFGVAQLVHDIREKRMPQFLKATGVIIVGAILALGSTASNLYVTYEYSKDTMRGEPILQSENPDPNSSSETDGLAWNYAMQWSNGPIDVFASFIPGVAGGGGGEKVSTKSPLYKDPHWRRFLQATNMSAPMYWGDLPFTSGPIYFGAAVFLFFIMGLILVDGPVKWWLGLGTLLTFMFSMGSNLEWFNRFFFDYVPLFNKFRTPNSVLTVTAFLMPLLGFIALGKIFNREISAEKVVTSLYISGGIVGAIFLFFIILGPGMYDFSAPGDARYPQQYGLNNLAPLIDARKALMRSDALRSLIIVLLGGGIVWAYIKDKLNRNYALAGIFAIMIFDLWTVGTRYLDHDDFLPRRTATTISPTPANEQILKDQDPHFRVYDLATGGNPFESSRASYFHKSLGGYHAAKLQRYADLIDRHLGKGNQEVINMLNTKYFIFPGQNGEPAVQGNPNALGNAWFIDTLKIVASANEEIDALDQINTANQAAIHREFADYVNGFDPNQEGSIRLTSYAPNKLAYESNSTSDQLAIFSEIWYGPNKGWQAYMDGEPVDHIRANYILRALKVPAGNHKIEFVFNPQSYYTGQMIATVSSSIILLSLLGAIGYYGVQFVRDIQNQPAPTPKGPRKPTNVKATVAQKGSRKKKKGKPSSKTKTK